MIQARDKVNTVLLFAKTLKGCFRKATVWDFDRYPLWLPEYKNKTDKRTKQQCTNWHAMLWNLWNVLWLKVTSANFPHLDTEHIYSWTFVCIWTEFVFFIHHIKVMHLRRRICVYIKNCFFSTGMGLWQLVFYKCLH